MTDRDHDIDGELEGFFSAAREVRPAPDEALMARIVADALAVQDGLQPDALPESSAPTGRRGLGGLWSILGGWPAMAGLATATVAGLWFGFSPPSTVSDTLDQLIASEADSSYVIDYGANYTLALYDGESQ